MIRLSKNFTLDEMLASQTAKRKNIMNVPDAQQMCNLAALVHNILQPLRDWWGKEVKIGSGFRSKDLNKAVGGVPNSQHLAGQAADLCIDGDLKKGRQWIIWIMENCDFDQLIFEHNTKGSYWVHVSFRTDGKNRRHCITYLEKK